MATRTHKPRTVLPFEPATQALPGVCVGHVVGFAPERGPLVDFPGNPSGPVVARLLVALDAPTLQQAASERCACAPQYRSAATSIGPKVSVSVRVFPAMRMLPASRKAGLGLDPSVARINHPGLQNGGNSCVQPSLSWLW